MFCPCVLSHFSIVIALLKEERADLCAFRAFVPLHLSVRDWLRLVIVALLAFFFFLFFTPFQGGMSTAVPPFLFTFRFI